MTKDSYWQLFADTGDPLSWLMYRATDEKTATAARNTKDAPSTPVGPTG